MGRAFGRALPVEEQVVAAVRRAGREGTVTLANPLVSNSLDKKRNETFHDEITYGSGGIIIWFAVKWFFFPQMYCVYLYKTDEEMPCVVGLRIRLKSRGGDMFEVWMTAVCFMVIIEIQFELVVRLDHVQVMIIPLTNKRSNDNISWYNECRRIFLHILLRMWRRLCIKQKSICTCIFYSFAAKLTCILYFHETSITW